MENVSSSLIILIIDVSEKYSLYSDIFLLIAGLIGNLILILVFIILQTFRGNQCAFLLTVESIANIGLFLSNFPPDIYTYITARDLMLISLIWCKFQSALSVIFGLASLFTVCFLTFDQFMSTNPRPNWRQISTLKLARRLTCINFCFILLHTIPYFIYLEIRPAEGCDIYNPIFRSYLAFFSYPILSSAMPIIVSITFSMLAYRNVRRIVRRQITVNRRRLDRQLTAMVLARVFCLILLGLPYITFSLYRLNLSTTEDNQLEVAIARLVDAIANSLLYLNFAINFYLFLFVSSRFRRQIKYLLVKKLWKSLNCYCPMDVHRRNRFQVAPETVRGNVFCGESV